MEPKKNWKVEKPDGRVEMTVTMDEAQAIFDDSPIGSKLYKRSAELGGWKRCRTKTKEEKWEE